MLRDYARSTLPDYVDGFCRGVRPEAVAAPKRPRKPSLAKLIAQARNRAVASPKPDAAPTRSRRGPDNRCAKWSATPARPISRGSHEIRW
jgi:hypothetical protein